MQNIEFVAFSFLIQGGRDLVGSAGLGGNGQFVRLAALRTLGEAPWQIKCLVEDLDVGLSLVKKGWRNRMCPHSWVAQQAVTNSRALIRQRTRWVQGHYSCWTHLPSLWRTRALPLPTRVDLSLHLFLAVSVLIVTTQSVLGLASFLGLYPIQQSLLAELSPNDTVYRVAMMLLACGPLTLMSVTYQHAATRFHRSGRQRLPLWALPGVVLTFTLYTYYWGVISSLRAYARIALRRDSWAKTERDPIWMPEAMGANQHVG